MDPTTLPSTLRARALTRQASARSPVHACWASSARPHVLGPVRAFWARPRLFCLFACPRLVGPVRPFAPLSAPFPPLPARPSAAFPPCPLIRSSAQPRRQRPSACSPVRSVHASSTMSTRPVRSVHTRQPLLYIPHPASPQIIQLLVVHVGPRVSVAPLRTAALRGLKDFGRLE